MLLSFVRDDTVFLDIGANLGFFSIKIAQRCRTKGKVYGFEPHPELVRLFRATSFLNGMGQLSHGGLITVYQCGLGNENRAAQFTYPIGHLGGGSLDAGDPETSTVIKSDVRRLDDMFPADFKFNLAKLDVEGHELEVLKGMSGIIARSQDAVIMIEKLGTDKGYEAEMEKLLRGFGLDLFAIEPGANLRALEFETLHQFDGYFLACQKKSLHEKLNRQRFSIYPSQLSSRPETLISLGERFVAAGSRDQILFYGPYWFLRRGVYKFKIFGSISGNIRVTLASRFGYAVQTFDLSPEKSQQEIIVEQDMVYFECVGRSLEPNVKVDIECIEIVRLG